MEVGNIWKCTHTHIQHVWCGVFDQLNKWIHQEKDMPAQANLRNTTSLLVFLDIAERK